MKNDNIRIGRISSVDNKNGTVKITYADRDDSTTDDIPYLTFNNEYKMPDIDDMVLVLHLSNDSSAAVVMGTFWNEANKPSETGQGLYRKEFGSTSGDAYMRYKDGELLINAKKVTIRTDKNTAEF